MISVSKRWWALTLTVALSMVLSVLSVAPSQAVNGNDWHYVPQQSCTPMGATPSADASSDSSNSVPGGASGGWLEKGSKENKIAQQIYDYFTKTKGTSGAFAVGVIANVEEESAHFKGIDVIEGGALAGENTKSGSSAGGGLFQFTPATKFENSPYWGKVNKDKGWAVENQVEFVWQTELVNGSIQPYLSSNMYGQTGMPTTMEGLFSTDDPRAAAKAFQVGYERPAAYHPVREDYASQANKVFNPNNKKADPSKWGLKGGPSNSSDSADLDSAKNKVGTGVNPCITSSKGDDDSSGGALGKDATGKHNYQLSGTWGKDWRWDKLPNDLKKYAIDPQSLGLKHGDCQNWTKWTGTSDPFLNGQCVALTKAFFGEFWEKGGQHPKGFNCNGNQCADAAASANGGSANGTPHAGAATSLFLDTPVGHTYIVSHVFENGDILAVEQNTPDSGATIGEQCSWNWRLIPKSGYQAEHAKFFTPDGYKPSSRAKTL